MNGVARRERAILSSDCVAFYDDGSARARDASGRIRRRDEPIAVNPSSDDLNRRIRAGLESAQTLICPVVMN